MDSLIFVVLLIAAAFTCYYRAKVDIAIAKQQKESDAMWENFLKDVREHVDHMKPKP